MDMGYVAKGFDERERAIAADLARLKEARDFADDAAAAFGIDEDGRYQVKLAMSEAVTNAIQHGSSSPDDTVTLSAIEESGALVFYVVDTGRFVPRMSPRGEMPESGRGLEFMRLVMDEVDVRPGHEGTVLRFSKRPG
jgi:anti-sigma regulatory factor (Ser/Thr protein kinase)